MTEIASGIKQVDTLLGGWERMTAGFLIAGPNPALVETGSQSSVPAVAAALKEAGLGPQDLRWIIVTHIHLDHAGGVGDLAKAFPSATVVVHENGARHLKDPSRLIDHASTAPFSTTCTGACCPFQKSDSLRRRTATPSTLVTGVT
jgi:glyoxylase-like metal-dependent hydrolase (beta-lactamase superfamily II)